jgi:hypothetical protein
MEKVLTTQEKQIKRLKEELELEKSRNARYKIKVLQEMIMMSNEILELSYLKSLDDSIFRFEKKSDDKDYDNFRKCSLNYDKKKLQELLSKKPRSKIIENALLSYENIFRFLFH